MWKKIVMFIKWLGSLVVFPSLNNYHILCIYKDIVEVVKMFNYVLMIINKLAHQKDIEWLVDNHVVQIKLQEVV